MPRRDEPNLNEAIDLYVDHGRWSKGDFIGVTTEPYKGRVGVYKVGINREGDLYTQKLIPDPANPSRLIDR